MSLADRVLAGDPRALPRLLTLIENRDPAGATALERLHPLGGRAHVVGVTGPPGSGKSTLLAALAREIRARGRRVAILAVDPSSPVSGGAVLGDRIRMMELHADPGVFIRSMASRGRVGGLAPATAAAVAAIDAAGYPVILVETVGTGQDGIDIATLAQTAVVVQVPGLGDGVQAIKAGQLEIGDLLVVNKADRPGSEDLLRLLRQATDRHDGTGWQPPVLPVVASTGDGVGALLDAIDRHRGHLEASGGLAARQRAAARAAVMSGLREAIERRIGAGSADDFAAAVDAVTARTTTPEAAVAALLARFDRAAGGGHPVGDEGGGGSGADAVAHVDDREPRGA